MSSEIMNLVETMVRENKWNAEKIAKRLDEMLLRGTDFSEAIPVLCSRLYDFWPDRSQPTVLRILKKSLGDEAFRKVVGEVCAAVRSKDRECRRKAADIRLAWAECRGGPRVAPQEVYASLAEAFTHKDNVLRKKVVACFHYFAWRAPDFTAVLLTLVAVYDGNDASAQEGVGRVLEGAAKAGLAIDAAVPGLERRLTGSGFVLTSLIAHHVHRNNAPRAVALFRDHGGGSYECQEIGQRVRPAQGTAGIEVLSAGLEHADPNARYTAALGLQKLADEGFDISPAFAVLGRALADATSIKLAHIKVGEQAARALAAAAEQEPVRSKVLEILKAAEQSENKTAAQHAKNAFGPPEAATKGADKCYQEARALWVKAVDLSVYDDKEMIRRVTPILERALRHETKNVKALALLCDLRLMVEAYDEALTLAAKLRELQPEGKAHQERLALLQKPVGAQRRAEICQYLVNKWMFTEDW